jgi:hypothetical protein
MNKAEIITKLKESHENNYAEIPLSIIRDNKDQLLVYIEDGQTYAIIEFQEEFHSFILANYLERPGIGYTQEYVTSDTFKNAYKWLLWAVSIDNDL